MRPHVSRRILLLALAAPLAACADRNPTAVDPGVPPPPEVVSVLTCTAQVRAATVVCRGASPSGVSADLIVGSPYVALQSSNVAYAADTFRADVTVRNQMDQPIGTTDGTTIAPQGIRVFFHSGPTVTSGTGTVEVQNEDGSAAFTGGSQPYFRYDTLLAPGQTSAPKQWRFTVPSTVATFQFVLYVAVPVPDEDGRVDVYPAAPQLLVGGRLPLLAVVRSGAGGIARGAPVTWQSSDTTVVRVDAAGVVTGVSLGEATVTATSGTRVSTVTVSVSTSDTQGPSLLAFSLSADSLDLGTGADSVQVELRLADGGVGVDGSLVSVFLLFGSSGASCVAQLQEGDIYDGVWGCTLVFSPYGEDGTYTPVVALDDQLNNPGNFTADSIAARGFDTGVVVTGSTTDDTAPALTGFTLSPDTVDVDTAAATVTVTVTATDGETGVSSVSLGLNSASAAQGRVCIATRTAGTAANGTWTCTIQIPEDAAAGAWTVSGLRIQDAAGNRTEPTAPELELLGFPTTVQVVSPNQDVTPPTFDGFAITPDSVDISAGPATVTFSVTASDAGTGVQGTVTYLWSPSGNLLLYCSGELASGTAASGTWTCSVEIPQFAETGEWRIFSTSAGDALGNAVQRTAADLEAAGLPSTVIVTN